MASGNFSQPPSTRQLSQLVGVTPRTIENWRSGRAVPSPLAERRLKELGLVFDPPRSRPKSRGRGKGKGR